MSLDLLIKESESILLIFGTWPKKNPSFLYNMKNILSLLCTTTLLVCMIINVVFNSGNFVDLSKSLYLTMPIFVSVCKAYVFLYNRQKMFKLVEFLNSHRFTKYLDVYDEDFKYYLKISKIIWVFAKGQITSYIIAVAIFPVLEHRPLPVDFPFLNSGSLHYPFYAFEVIALAITGYQTIALDILFCSGVVSNAAIQLGILSQKLIDTKTNVLTQNEDREDDIYQYLKECCMHYSDIEEFLKLTEIFSIAYFAQLMSATIAICNSGIILLSVGRFSAEAISLYCYLFAVTTQLGLACFFGNDVLFKSSKVPNSCYMSNWYEFGRKNRKILFMLMERTQRPMDVKAIGYVTLSFNTFVSILKMTYSYFTLMQNFTFE